MADESETDSHNLKEKKVHLFERKQFEREEQPLSQKKRKKAISEAIAKKVIYTQTNRKPTVIETNHTQ